MRVAMIQSPVVPDKAANIAYAVGEIRAAAQKGIDLAVLPEIFCCPYSGEYFHKCSEEDAVTGAGGPVQTAMSALAKELGIYIVAGSIPEWEGETIYNTAFVYGPDGSQVAKHRKVHLFDIDVEGGQSYKESDSFGRGDRVTTFDTPFGKIGVCICFDFRFEELARVMCLRGARAIVVPAAFNMTTGPAHWDLMFRQRAVDNQLFTIGVAPARDVNGRYVSWGNSMAVEPWGSVVAHFGSEAHTEIVDLDMSRVDSIRRQLPILSARRTDLYDIHEL